MSTKKVFTIKLAKEIFKSISTFLMLAIPISFICIGNTSYDFGLEKHNINLYGTVDIPSNILNVNINESAFKNLKNKKHIVTSKEYVSFVNKRNNASVDDEQINDYILKEKNNKSKAYYFIDKNTDRSIAYSTDQYGKIGHLIIKSKSNEYKNKILEQLEIYKNAYSFDENSEKTIIDKRNKKIKYYQSSKFKFPSGTENYDFSNIHNPQFMSDVYNEKYENFFFLKDAFSSIFKEDEFEFPHGVSFSVKESHSSITYVDYSNESYVSINGNKKELANAVQEQIIITKDYVVRFVFLSIVLFSCLSLFGFLQEIIEIRFKKSKLYMNFFKRFFEKDTKTSN
jgi:hypothetical protein